MTASSPQPDAPAEATQSGVDEPGHGVASNHVDQEQTESSGDADSGRFARTWFWMILVSGFGLFLVFASVPAHYWEENAAGTRYVPVTRGMQVLDIWRAQVDGLPEVAHQTVLKAVFLVSTFGFLGLAVVALWLASVEVRSNSTEPGGGPGSTDRIDIGDGGATASPGHASG
ncbi:MAG: hypothetical protein H0T91_03275 [Propionibacteriaceae bacterium]|nr:hypothetical protein [Propionibacteriaceae bacterium]